VNQFDTGKFGEVAFTVADLAMTDIDIPMDLVSMKLEGTNVKLEVVDITAKLEKFAWSYEKKTGFPKLKDSGKGTAIASGVKILVTMAVGASHTGPTLNVQSCTVNIGKLDLKISQTAMSLFYNLVLAAFKKTIKSNIESALSDLVTEAVTENASDLMGAFD